MGSLQVLWHIRPQALQQQDLGDFIQWCGACRNQARAQRRAVLGERLLRVLSAAHLMPRNGRLDAYMAGLSSPAEKNQREQLNSLS